MAGPGSRQLLPQGGGVEGLLPSALLIPEVVVERLLGRTLEPLGSVLPGLLFLGSL